MSVQYCTIACDKGHITAHKLKLCEHSKYLQDILSKYPHAEHPIIILTELNIIDVKILVNYMYTGELVINTDSSPTSLLRAAQILKIDSLTAEDNDDEDLLEQHQDQQRPHQQQPCDDSSESSNHHVADSSESSHHHVNESSPNNIYSSNNNNNNNNHHRRHPDAMDDEDEDEDDEDDDDLRMDDEDAGNSHSRLINSIKNIYSLNQNFHSSSPSQEQNLLGVASSNSNHQAQQLFGLDFGGNPKHNNTPNSLSQHLQQQLSSHLDLQDLQDSEDSRIDKNNKIRCHLCNIGLSDVKCLYRHVLTRHLPEKWGYKCEFCDREFSRDDHLMRHYTTKHKNMEFDREKIRETRRLNREMAKNFHDQISTV